MKILTNTIYQYQRLLLFLAIILVTADAQAQQTVSLSGRLSSTNPHRTVHLHNTDSINISIPVNADHSFSYAGNGIPQGLFELEEVGTIYINTGYKLKIAQAGNGSYHFTGTGAQENNALQAVAGKLKTMIPMNENGSWKQQVLLWEVSDFQQKIDSALAYGKQQFGASSDTFFRHYAYQDLLFRTRSVTREFIVFYGTDVEKQKQLPGIMQKIDIKDTALSAKMQAAMQSIHIKNLPVEQQSKLLLETQEGWSKNDGVLFSNSFAYKDMLTKTLATLPFTKKYFVTSKMQFDAAGNDVKMQQIVDSEITAPNIHAYYSHYYTANVLRHTKDTVLLNQYYERYVASHPRADYLADIEHIYHNATSYMNNKPAPSFAFNDVYGKTVLLESLRGRYVYIDVWATWCGPCKREIPNLQKIEEQYRDRNIQFVSISIDQPEDKAKWKAFVKNNQLGGIQLLADNAFESAFVKKMGIDAIPRFILIDPAGMIVAANALRPSDEGLKEVLEKVLR